MDARQYAWLIVFGLGGLSWGSFLNVVIDRAPRGLSLIYPSSHCEACGKKLAFWELVPLFSYIALGGKCHSCGARIPLRLPLVELFTGLAFSFIFFQYGYSIKLAAYLFYFSLFILIFVIDLDNKTIPHFLIYPGLPVSFLISTFLLDIGFISSLVGGGVAFALLLIPYLIYKGGMGGGDVKLAGLMGLALGFPNVLTALFLAIILGGLFSLILLLFKIRGRKEAIPFGPFLSIGFIASLIWGRELMYLYLTLLR